MLFAFQCWAQVVDLVPDSILQSVLLKNATDTIKQKPEQQYLDAPVHYPARDSIVYSYSDNKIKMYGDAKVEFEDILLEAEYIEMTMDKKEVYASGVEDSTGQIKGKPKFKKGEEEFEATLLRYNFGSERAWVTDVVSKQGEGGLLHSHITKRDTLGNLHIKDGKFTTCEADQPHFYFAISKGIMTSKKSVVSGPAYLVVEGIPIYFLGLPFGFFPKQEKKASGIIMPKVGEEVNRGFYLRDFGYYFAGKEKFDLTLKGDLYSKGSWKGSATSSYRKRYKFNGNVGFTYAKNIFGERDIDVTSPRKDFSVRWSHSQDSKAHPYRTFSANVNFSNSKFDQNNEYSMENRMSSTKSSSITFSRKFPNNLFNFTAKLGHTQNSQNKMVTLNLPSGTFTVGRFYPFKRKTRVGKQKWYEMIDMRYSSNFENQVRSPDSLLFQPDIFDRMQNGFKHEVPVQASFKLISNMTLTPSLRYQGLLYFNYIQKEWDIVEEEVIVNRINQLKYVQTLAPNINLTYNPRIYGFFDFKKGRISTIRHVATPSLSFSYRPDIGIDDSRYYDSVQRSADGVEERYSIFAESLYRMPSVAGRSGNVSFRLGNNLEMKVHDKTDTTGLLNKIKILDDLSLSTSYDIFRDSLNLSPISFSARTRIMNNFDIKFSSTLDPYSIAAESSGTNIRYYTVNQFEVAKSGKLARLTNANLTLGFSLPMKKSPSGGGGGGASAAKGAPSPDKNENDDYWEYNMPWNLRVNYSLRYQKLYMEGKVTQSISFSGGFSLTPNWKFDISSGYDFVQGEVTYTRIGITRNLHCWRMTLDLIPIGQYKSYTFQINIVANMFKDVKFRKAKSWYDNF